MIDPLVRWSLKNRVAVVILSIVLLAAGGYVAARMPVDVFPDLTAPTVTVLVEGHGMSPLEMETLVTFPIETAVNGAGGVRRVRSGTALGIAVVWVEFDWGTDIHRARQTVAERLTAVASTLPEQVEPPSLAPVSSIMGEIVFASLTSDRHDGLALRATAAAQIRRRLLSVSGVSQVTPIGGDVRQYQVVLAPDRMRAFSLSAMDVVRGLEETNENVAGGVLNRGAQELVVEGVGRVASASDLERTVVAVRDGVPIKVSDVGIVTVGAAMKRGTGAASRRGPAWEAIIEPGVIIAIQKQPGANTLELTSRLDAALDEIQSGLPEGMHLEKNLFRQSTFIENSIANAIRALREGGFMVALVVILFLASLRASLITLVALPLSLVIAILALEALGASINTMTLGGMAIAIGALVDDAIIVVENIVRRLRINASLPLADQRPTIDVVHSASREVYASIVMATVIILLVFAPLFLLSGVEGRLLRPLGIAFTVALAASLLTALTVTPALCASFLPRSRTVRAGKEPWFVGILKRPYRATLDLALDFPIVAAGVGVVLLGAAFVGAGNLGRNFLPEFNEGAMVVGLVTVPGTSLAESDKMAHAVEETLMRHPEIAAIGRRTGRAEEDEHVQGVEASEIDLTLDMDAPTRLGLPKRSKEELLEALRRDLALVPGVQATFGQPIGHRIDHMLSGTRANIAVKIFGDELPTLRTLGNQIENVMREVPGVVDLSTEQQTLVPTLRVEFDRAAISRHGLSVGAVAEVLAAATTGVEAGQILEGVQAFELVVRIGKAGTATAESIGDTVVTTPTGMAIPLRALATVREDSSPNFISRENVQRKLVVMCNVAGRDMRSVVSDIRSHIEAKVEMPPGYYVEYGGQFESAEETNRKLLAAGGLIIVAIAGLLFLMFRSVRDSVLIMINLPLALIGGVLGVHLSGGVLSVASIIGFITVFGVAARNGIMLVSHIRHLQREEGVTDFREAVRQGAIERLAPILMTALAAGLALVPLALHGEDPGNEILTPMAIVILFGLLSSTFLNVILVPALFLKFATPALDEPTAPLVAEVSHA